jgi:DNA-directed RNA polymerase subunit RPC12/RpoP
MGNFDDAIREMLDADRVCPKCSARNKPRAKLTLEHEQNGSITCAVCSHNWFPKEK